MLTWLNESYPALYGALDNIYLYRNSLNQGFLLTIKLGLYSVVLAVILGLLSALSALNKNKGLRLASLFYTSIFRGIPDIVVIFLLYYGGLTFFNHLSDRYEFWTLELDPFWSGVTSIGLIFGAFLSETFRGSLIAVPQGQYESCTALGLSRTRTFFKIIFPQAMRFALAGLENNWLVLLKSTALISLIGLKDLMGRAGDAGGATRSYTEFYLAVGVGYLCMTIASIVIFKFLKSRYGIKSRQGAMA